MLEVKNLSKSWMEFELRDICLKVERQEYFVILGPSGAGKTLLLETIAGIFVPDQGRIFLSGEDITALPPEKRGIAYIPQNYALFPHLNVHDNIAFGLKLRKTSRNEMERKISEISEVLGISHLLKRNPKTLSGGEQQRVAIARALVLRPEILLLDEPFSNLDVETRNRLIAEMKEWKRELEFTALHVTHSFEEAISLGDKIGVMVDGRLEQVGDVKEVFSRPKNERIARFLGFENIIEGHASGKALKINGTEIELPFEADGRIRVGIRPEDIIISRDAIRTSARNVLRAKVKSIEETGALVKLTLDAEDVELRAYITRSSLLEMGIKRDEEIYVSFKATAIHIF
ncbi:tungstate ABC transporter ATP-binding protein WtpC [Geoglobus acetivorans]|uniref:Molybdate/tungstate import ATP-binding protein WtpC n=1 Tax=Geoglobus acetivorans TaxID=565033 RepID=A0ABZ3H545_GEOAI|nr:ATP-binding cassette domain-containing protein [Geoglobus acetivorans]